MRNDIKPVTLSCCWFFSYLITMKSYLVLLFIPLMSYTQHLDKHQWKERLLLVIAYSYENIALQKQLTLFKNTEKGLAEQKLVVYQITPSDYKEGMQSSKSLKGSSLYQQYNQEKKEFKLILIGLDGGVKESYFSPTPSAEIYGVIDQMPMRQQELRNKP